MISEKPEAPSEERMVHSGLSQMEIRLKAKTMGMNTPLADNSLATSMKRPMFQYDFVLAYTGMDENVTV